MTTDTRGVAPAGCRRRASQRAIDVTRPQPWLGSSTAPLVPPFTLPSGRMSVGLMVHRFAGRAVGQRQARTERRLESLAEQRHALGLVAREVARFAGIVVQVEEHLLSA